MKKIKKDEKQMEDVRYKTNKTRKEQKKNLDKKD